MDEKKIIIRLINFFLFVDFIEKKKKKKKKKKKFEI